MSKKVTSITESAEMELAVMEAPELGDLGAKAPKTTRRSRAKAIPVAMPAPVKIETTTDTVTLNDYFVLEKGTFEILKHNILKNVSTMLIGPTGLGKTEVVINIAKVLGIPVTVFDMGTMTDPIMGLVGTHVITVKDGKTYSEFKKSRFSEVIQKPGIVLLDEISRASATANNLLFPCLDYRRELPMEYAFGDTTPIKVHEKCVFFSTANMGSQYTGTHKLDRALIDRFMMIMMDPLSTGETIASLQFTYPGLAKEKLSKIVKVYDDINKEHNEFRIGFNLSMRHLKIACRLVLNGFTIYDTYYSICKGIGGKDGLKSIETIMNNIGK